MKNSYNNLWMKHRFVLILLLIMTLRTAATQPVVAQPNASNPEKAVVLWSTTAPGEDRPVRSSVLAPAKSDGIDRIGEVTIPLMHPYRVGNPKNGTSIIVCPGGGYNILAITHEGYEIAEWLNKQGYNAYVLEYRVPQRPGQALMDLQRAIRVVRAEQKLRGMPVKVGVIGFSAGGSLCARAATAPPEGSYPASDETDRLSCRPDFGLLIYPAYLDKGENRTITPEVKPDATTPPLFLFATADDTYGNSALEMAKAMRDAKAPVELHFMNKGGHGYGLRKGNAAAETWPVEAAQWLEKIGSTKN